MQSKIPGKISKNDQVKPPPPPITRAINEIARLLLLPLSVRVMVVAPCGSADVVIVSGLDDAFLIFPPMSSPAR